MIYAGYALNVITLGVKHWMSFIQDVQCVNPISYTIPDTLKEEPIMMLRITVDIEETTGDNSETSTIRKFIKIPDDASADVILETIPVALKHAAQQIVERIKEGIDE